MRSSASSQEVSRHAPSVRTSRRRGRRTRIGLSMISREAWPRMQRKPRLSGFSSSPWTLRTRSSWISTSIPQYVGWQFIGHMVRTRRIAWLGGRSLPVMRDSITASPSSPGIVRSRLLARSIRSEFLPRRRRPGISRIRCSCRFYQQEARFLLCVSLMLNASGHHKQLSRPETHRAIAQPNLQLTVENQEEVVGVVVLVPDELALDLHDHDVVLVELGNRSRLPVILEPSKL